MIIFKSLFQKQTPEVQKALVGAAKEPPLTAQRLQDKQASIKNELVETSGTQIDPLDDAVTSALQEMKEQRTTPPKNTDIVRSANSSALP